MDPHIAETKLSALVRYQVKRDALICKAVRNTLYCEWQSDRRMRRGF